MCERLWGQRGGESFSCVFLRLRLLLLCFDSPPFFGPVPQILADLAQIRKDAEDCKCIADQPVTPGNSGFALGIG